MECARGLGPITTPLCLRFAPLPKRNAGHTASQGHCAADVTVIMEDARQTQTHSGCSKMYPSVENTPTATHLQINAFPILGGRPCFWPPRHPFPPQRTTLFRRPCRGPWPSLISDNLGEAWGHPSEGSCRVACFVVLPVTSRDFSPTCCRRRDRTGRNFTLCRRHLL